MTTPTHVPARPEPQRATGDCDSNWLDTWLREESSFSDTLGVPLPTTARTAVLSIAGLPCELRWAVETAMVEAIPSESELYTPCADPLTADWCTAWQRDRDVFDYAAVTCRQVITGSDEELAALDCELTALIAAHNATAENSVASVNIRMVD